MIADSPRRGGFTTAALAAASIGLMLGGQAHAQDDVMGAGATLFKDFFPAPASTNDFIDVNQDGVFGFDISGALPLQQLAPGVTINPTTGAVTFVAGGINVPEWAFQYRSVGSVKGFGQFVDYQLLGTVPGVTASEGQLLNRNEYVTSGKINYGPNNGANEVNPIAAPYASGMADPIGRPYDQVDFAFLDVPSTLAVTSGNAANGNWNKRPTEDGYGFNSINSSTGFVSQLESLERGALSLNQNTAAPDANTIYDYNAAFVPVNIIANAGTGKENVRATEMQHLFVSGRMNSGENLVGATRDAGSGTRNAAMNSLGIDPAWGRGDNVGDRTDTSDTTLLGEDFQPTNNGGSSIQEGVVQNHRLAIGYTGFAGSSRSVQDAIDKKYEILNIMNDHVGGTQYVRPSVDTVLDNASADTGYRIGGNGSFVTRGDWQATDVDYDQTGVIGTRVFDFNNDGTVDTTANGTDWTDTNGNGLADAGEPGVEDAPWEVGNGNPFDVANAALRDYMRNIDGSVQGFTAAPARDDNNNMPGQFLAYEFFLPAAIDALALDNGDPTNYSANAGLIQSLQDFVRAQQKAIRDTPTFGNVGRVSIRKVDTGYSDDQVLIDAGQVVGSQYITADGATLVGYGSTMEAGLAAVGVRNRIAGDFDADGVRTLADTQAMIDAYNARGTLAARQAWAVRTGADATDGNAVFELLGDFDGNGSFDEEDIRYWADGLALSTTAGIDLDGDLSADATLNRKEGFTAVDNASGNNFFGTTLATIGINGKVYEAGDSRADVAGNTAVAGAAPSGSDGRVDAKDIDYVYAQFKGNRFVNGDANWANLNEAVGFDLSADMTGDLIVNQADVDDVVVNVLGTNYGDADLNRSVNLDDANTLVGNFGNTTGQGWANGNFDGDGDVDLDDANTLVGNFGTTVSGANLEADPFATSAITDDTLAIVSANSATATIEADGSILLNANQIALYKIFVGDSQGEQVTGTDVLFFDNGVTDPAAARGPIDGFGPTTKQDQVDGFAEENFGEFLTSNSITTTTDLNQDPSEIIDTLVNVDLASLGGNQVWLLYNTVGSGNEGQLVRVIPEPASLALLGFGGMLLIRRRQTR